MSAMKIKKGDTVKVIAGKDNGKEGKVLAVNAKDNTVVVENINKVTKHSKPTLVACPSTTSITLEMCSGCLLYTSPSPPRH